MMSKTRAVLILSAGLLLFVVLVATPTPSVPPLPAGQRGDIATYRVIVSRLRAGEPYYGVLGDELRRGEYATREIFNWRTPLLWSGLARVSDAAGQGVLIGLGLLLLSATLLVTLRESAWTAGGSTFMQAGTVLFLVVPTVALMGETWAGVLIGLSLCMYARQKPNWAAPLGLVALFLRELAAPYCVVCAIWAVMKRRWREVAIWASGASLYACYYGWHVLHVWSQRQPTDLAFESSWLEMRGLQSLLLKAQWQGWLLLWPPWVTALALVLVAAGIFFAHTPVHARLAGGAYVAFFLVAGKPFDGYWGLLAWPSWALACGYGVELMRQAACVVLMSPRRL
jgi:hypothetical protein